LARYLANRPIGSIYSSDLPRTVQTATPLAEQLKLTPVLDERWREIHLGIFQGLTSNEAEQRYPNEVAARRADYWNYAIPQGESRRQLMDRAHAVWQSVVEQAVGPEVVVVSHGGTLKVLLLKLFGEGDDIQKISLDNTSITTLERDGDGWLLKGIAETLHLVDGF
jgi:broad specificity phosphatase PhoE